MKRLAQQLTEDNLVIKNYVIAPSSEKFATHMLYNLPRYICEELADRIDRGYYFPPELRYAYRCSDITDETGIPCVTPSGALRRAIYKHFGDVKYLKIIKIQEDEKDNSVPETTSETIH
jgi:hypothetical protein